MSAFEFFFSFYGLILGLAVVEVITGFARAMRTRTRIRLGYATPLLALFILLDLVSFWSGSWLRFQDVAVTPALLVVALTISGIYFLAASLVFPERFDDWGSADDFYDAHKRWVLLGSFTANTLAETALTIAAGKPESVGTFWLSPSVWLFLGPLLGLMLGVALVRDRRINAVFLSLICLLYLWMIVFP